MSSSSRRQGRCDIKIKIFVLKKLVYLGNISVRCYSLLKSFIIPSMFYSIICFYFSVDFIHNLCLNIFVLQTIFMAPIKTKRRAHAVGPKNMVNGRCYFSHFVNFMVTLVPLLSHEQKVRITGTPFGHLLGLPYIKQSRPVLDTQLSFWDDEEEGFWFGKVLVPFVGSDFALILGLSATGDEVELHSKGRVTSDLIIRFFEGDHKKANRNAVKNRLQFLGGKSGQQDVEDFTKLWVLYVFVTILFPTIHYYVPKALCSYLDDLDRLGSYSWGLAVFTFLRQQIPSVADSVRSRNITGKGSAKYMDGCTVALVAWAVEHANSLVGSQRPTFMYPRLLRWSNVSFPRKVDVISEIMKNLKRYQVIEKLEPREEELHILSRGRPRDVASIEMRRDDALQKGLQKIFNDAVFQRLSCVLEVTADVTKHILDSFQPSIQK
ncbi:uncharacterized protein LOC113461235 isoform X2 [Phoenix dactylifera]|uniref:Uncharacterized protein LOC113461235 isoform X2 n=1 Tax=Phoenix dactylifera TaxID=42345 RepID=A0A8B9ADP5_PHODC|nr:uncharacterized protein LOC113461235 isoform X2 [Phoenix dactylifera]